MDNKDIDAVFLADEKKANALALRIGLFMLVLFLALFALPLVSGGSEMIREIPGVMRQFGWKPLVIGIIAIGVLLVAGYFGKRDEKKALKSYREATLVFHSATPRPVTAHVWCMYDPDRGMHTKFFSIRPSDALAERTPRVVKSISRQNMQSMKNTVEEQLSADWYAAPEISSVEVLRFPDGSVIPVKPVEQPAITLAPPPRVIAPLVSYSLLTMYGFVWLALACFLILGEMIGMLVAPTALTNALYHALPSKVATGRITGIVYSERGGAPKLAYQFGANHEDMIFVDEATARRFPPGTSVTVEYLRDFPRKARVREIPPRPIADRTTAVTLFWIVSPIMLLFLFGVVTMICKGVRQLHAIRSYAFGWATLILPDGVSPLRPTTLTVRLRDESGETRAVTPRKALFYNWMRDMETPVLFDPHDPTRMMPLATAVTPSEFTITPDGNISLNRSGICILLAMAGFSIFGFYGIWMLITA